MTRGVLELLGVIDGEAPRDSDGVGDAVVVEELVGEPDIDDVGVDSAVAVPLALGVELGVPVAEGDVEAVTLDDGEGDAGALALLLGLAPDDSEDVGDTERDALSDFVDEGDTEDVGDGVVVDAGEVVADGVDVLEVEGSPLAEALTDGLGVSLGVREGLAPAESVPVTDAVPLDVSVADEEALRVLLPLELAVSVVEELADGVCVIVGDPVELPDDETLEDSGVLGVTDADAPTLTEAVGVRDKDIGRLCVELDVGDGDGVPVGVVLAVGVIVADRELDTLDVSETVGDTDGLTPEDKEDVGEWDVDALKDAVVDGVIDAVPVIVEVPDTVSAPLVVNDAV